MHGGNKPKPKVDYSLYPLKSIEEQRAITKTNRILTFIITFFAYVSIHATRTAWSYSKRYFKQDLQIDTEFLGQMDSIFFFCYAMSFYIFGTLGDRSNLKYFNFIGMFSSACIYGSMGIFGLLYYKNKAIFLTLMGCSAAFQSLVHPGLISSMGQWFGKGHRGFLMGLWSVNANCGDIVGFIAIGDQTIDPNNAHTWTRCILTSATALGCMAIVLLLFLNPYPYKLGVDIDQVEAEAEAQEQHIEVQVKSEETGQKEKLLQKPEVSPKKSQKQIYEHLENLAKDHKIQEESNEIIRKQVVEGDAPSSSELKQINFFNAWCIPGVAIYACCYFCLKATQYGLLFWLPFFLQSIGISSQSSELASMLDVGTFFGSIITGQVSDKVGKRAVVMSPQLYFSGFLMFIIYFFLGPAPLPYYFIVLGIGIFLGGPYNIIAVACSMDIAKQECLKNSAGSLSTIISLIEGFGAIGTTIVQLIIGEIAKTNIKNIFLLFTILSCFAGTILLKYACNELKEMKEEEKKQKDVELVNVDKQDQAKK